MFLAFFSVVLGIILSFSFFGFGVFEGVKLGTIICAVVNGFLIGLFSKMLEYFFEFKNKFKLEKHFDKINPLEAKIKGIFDAFKK